MNKNVEIDSLFQKKLLKEICLLYRPEEVAKALTFKEALITAYLLLYNKEWDSDIQNYAADLLKEIRNIYPNHWIENWEYDALLGLAYYITSQHEERYAAYKRAFEKIQSNPPPRLLIELARCCICPGPPPISYDEGISLVMQALKQGLYTDGISVLCNLYSLKEDKVKLEYWSKILKNSNQNLDSPSIEPKFLVEEYLKNEKQS